MPTRLPQGFAIRLSDGRSKRNIDLALVGGVGGLQIGTISQDNTVVIRNEGKHVGDFNEQRDWKNGRGIENFSDNGGGFWHSENAWTLTPKHVHQTLQWYFANGLRNADYYMPTRDVGGMSWQPLIPGTRQYVSIAFVASASYSIANLMMWIRRVGSPGPCNLSIWSDSVGLPLAQQQFVSFSTSDITDTVSVLVKKALTPVAVTAGTTYHFVIYCDAGDSVQNHWEVGVDASTSSSKTSLNGAVWNVSAFTAYFRATDADSARRFFKVMMDGALYVVDSFDNGATASTLYINGDRGKATGGGASLLTDSTKAWVTNRWTGAYVKIIRGTGRGQIRQIASNTATGLVPTVNFTTAPDATSEYIIYATPWFTPITLGNALSWVSGRPAVANGIMYFPQGDAVGIIHVQWNSGTAVHDSFKETPAGTNGTASLLIKSYDKADGPQLWRANNSAATGSAGAVKVSRALVTPAGTPIAYNTALIFKTAIPVGDSTFPVTGMEDKEGSLYVFKEDGVGIVTSDQLTSLLTGIDGAPDPANGAAVRSHQQFLFYSWLHSLIQVYGSSHDDIGKSWNFPNGHEGNVSGLDSYLSLVLIAIDADNGGVSSTMAFDSQGFHTLFTAPYPGLRVRGVMAQPCYGTRNRVWTDINGELVYQEMPYKKMSPRLDSGVRYFHEAVLEGATLDMDTAAALPKFITDLTLLIRNLGAAGNSVEVDWQADDKVHTTTWINATSILSGPEGVAFLGLQNIRKFTYRLRIRSASNTTPIDIEGIVPNGFARTPFKMLWTMQIQAGGISSRGRAVPADKLMRWILDSSRAPYRIRMTSIYEMADNFWVIVHPGTFQFTQPQQGAQGEQAVATLILQEA